MSENYSRKSWRYPALLACVIFLSMTVFLLSYRHDNKYTYPTHPSENGVTRLYAPWYAENPLLFLARGWEFYQYALLTPEDLSTGAYEPDATVLLGQYTGFGLGDKTAEPYGSATYRLTILTDGVPRDYALELPEIFSSYRIWINGELKKSVGVDSAAARDTQTVHSMLTFRGEKSIEIVVAASNYTHYYSGMVYPPAFGNPEAVYRLLATRVLIHGTACAMALLIGFFCLVLGIRYAPDARLMALLCLCFIGYAGYPVVHMLGLPGEFWYHVERVSLYAMFAVIIWLQGRLCGIGGKVYRPAMAVAGGICALSLGFHGLYRGGAWGMALYSDVITAWKWLAAAYLMAAAVYAIRRGSGYAKAMLAGFCVFGCALVFDRLYPWFEPVLLGWHIELAGFVLLLIVAGVILLDTARIYRDNLALAEENAEARQALREAEARYNAALEKQGSAPYLSPADFGLSARETDVLWLLLDGKSRPEIADLLGISMGSVNTYCSRINRKTDSRGLPDLFRRFGVKEKETEKV